MALTAISDILLNRNSSSDDLMNGAQILLFAYEISHEEINFLTNSDNEIFLKNKLLTYLLTTVSGLGILSFCLAPIHAIAKGMKSLKLQNDQTWENIISSESPYEFSLKVQGGFNREKFANYFVFDISLLTKSEDEKKEINKKWEWLIYWILNLATDEELRKLLKFMTGSSSLPYNIKIIVESQKDDFFPGLKAHTCSYTIELSQIPCSYGKYNDSSFEDFINTIKNLNLTNEYSDE